MGGGPKDPAEVGANPGTENDRARTETVSAKVGAIETGTETATETGTGDVKVEAEKTRIARCTLCTEMPAEVARRGGAPMRKPHADLACAFSGTAVGAARISQICMLVLCGTRGAIAARIERKMARAAAVGAIVIQNDVCTFVPFTLHEFKITMCPGLNIDAWLLQEVQRISVPVQTRRNSHPPHKTGRE